jgi:hypothetical protein
VAITDVLPDSPYYAFFANTTVSRPLPGGDGRSAKLKRAWDAYGGVFPAPLKVRPGAPNDNVTVSLCKRVVDASVAFLFGKGVTWDLGVTEGERSPDETFLDDVWAASKKMQLLHRLATNGGVCGQAFLKLRVAQPFPELKVIDPTMVTVVCADDDHERVLSYAIRWNGTYESKPAAFRQYIVRVPAGSLVADGEATSLGEHWLILDQWQPLPQGSDPDDDRWRLLREEPWPWPFAPIVECQNLPKPNGYWGISDIEPDVIHLNEAINRVASNTNKILRNHAHPKTYTLGLDENQTKQIKVDSDGVLHIPGDKTEVAIDNLEMQSDLVSSLKFLDELKGSLREASRTPEIASGRVEDLAYLAALSMQILYGPLIEKTDAKRETYGWLIVETNRRLLAMAGKGQANIVRLTWGNALPRDRQVEALTALQLQQAGVSRETTLTDMGFDPVHEESSRQTDRTEDQKFGGPPGVKGSVANTQSSSSSQTQSKGA